MSKTENILQRFFFNLMSALINHELKGILDD